MYLYRAVPDLHCYVGFSLVAESGGYSLVGYAGFSLHWLPSGGTWAFEPAAFGSCGAVACEVFPDQGSNPCPLH